MEHIYTARVDNRVTLRGVDLNNIELTELDFIICPDSSKIYYDSQYIKYYLRNGYPVFTLK